MLVVQSEKKDACKGGMHLWQDLVEGHVKVQPSVCAMVALRLPVTLMKTFRLIRTQSVFQLQQLVAVASAAKS